jgi:hypothetical protein
VVEVGVVDVVELTETVVDVAGIVVLVVVVEAGTEVVVPNWGRVIASKGALLGQYRDG